MREETKQSIAIEWIVCGIVFLVIIALGAYALMQGGRAAIAGIKYVEAKNAAIECAKWQDWEAVFPKWDERSETGYYITQWQKDQCDEAGIELRAHVIPYKQ